MNCETCVYYDCDRDDCPCCSCSGQNYEEYIDNESDVIVWRIFALGTELPDLKIPAFSLDDALANARKVDDRYCGAQPEKGTNRI